MKVNLKNLVSISEANQNFSKVARLVDKEGLAVILKNNRPRYVIIEYSQFEAEKVFESETVEDIANRILARHIETFKELGK